MESMTVRIATTIMHLKSLKSRIIEIYEKEK